MSGISDHQKAAAHRLNDAWALYQAGRWKGSMYIGGYAVECVLKAKLMERHRCRNLRELEERLHDRRLLAADDTVFTHRMELLLRLCDGMSRLSQNKVLWADFAMINRWIPAWRYDGKESTAHDAEDFLRGIERVYGWAKLNL